MVVSKGPAIGTAQVPMPGELTDDECRGPQRRPRGRGTSDVRKLLACLLLLAPTLSHAWWNDDWNFRKEIALDLTPAGGDIAATATDVPVLLRLSLANFGFFGDVKPDGSDFRVVAGDDKTPLKFHVERFDAANQMAFIWVKVPQLTGGVNTEKIYLYYGNPNAPSAAEVPGTYDANQALVLHLSETAGNPVDSTAFANAVATSNAELSAASLIGGGATFAGANAITVPSSASLRLVPAKGLTMSAWLRLDAEQTDAHLLSLVDGPRALVLGVNGLSAYARLLDGSSAPAEVRTAPTLVAGQWHHLAVTAGNGRIALYVDGVEVGSSPATIPEIAGVLTIGAGASGANFLAGAVDEVQVSTLARAPEWIRAQARGQGPDAMLVGYGNDAQREGEDVSYIKVTMQNVTLDGWIVIVILAIMFVISLLIMISKAVMLGRVAKANKAFMKEFERLKGDITGLDRAESDEDEGDEALSSSALLPALDGKDDRFRLSTLYRLYHHGVQELQARTARSVGASAVQTLSPQAMQAVRATMDASLVRTTQKLQSKMVLLTIAISGGPFLGLLGTVVGVMITFAAIAASGDVNVNSIAPGIAAALAATVAGLAVAIPALFGYNWLNSLIKEIVADMRVFVDEFVTRAAERYS
jgi:biopolymer transport protein ExbB